MDEVARIVGGIHPSLATLTGLPLWIFVAVAALTLTYMVGYLVQGLRVGWQLRSVSGAVHAMRRQGTAPDPNEVKKFFVKEPLRHLWDEYQDTLHELRSASSGAGVMKEYRATVPAETMFTREVLVDTRLFDEFVRHLPGVLTGLGIVGTFAGLLTGLQTFKPFPIEEAVRGLGPLLEGVQHAFVASGVAIFCAMFVVFTSRFVLAQFYRLVERLNHGIDSLYSTGAGEEYLSRLVRSSEESAASTAQLKDALVEDLRKMMTNLVERQIEAQQVTAASMGQNIGDAITAALGEPMKRVGEAMEVTARGNGEQVNSMLETLLTGFMAKLEDTFGGQMRGINEQMQRSMDSMASVQGSLQSLLEDIKRTNEHAASQMSGTLEEAMKKAADNQQVLTDQMREFVQDFRRLVTEEQSRSKEVMDDAVMKVLGEVSSAVEALEAVRKSAAAEEAGRNERLASQTNELVGGLTAQMTGTLQETLSQTSANQQQLTEQMREFVQDFRRIVTEEQGKSKSAMDEAVMKVLGDVAQSMESLEAIRKSAASEEAGRNAHLSGQTNQLVSGLSTQVENLLDAVSAQVTKTQANIDALGNVSLRAIDGMNQGALTMGSAAQRFESAGSSVSGVFERSSKVASNLDSAASSLQAASTAVQRGFEQYDSTRRTVDAQVAALTGLVEAAKREAGVSQELVESMRSSAEKLREAESQSRAHLDQVNAALVKAFSDFGTSLVNQVRSTISETDKHLAQGTGHLNGVVQELASVVQRMKKA